MIRPALLCAMMVWGGVAWAGDILDWPTADVNDRKAQASAVAAYLAEAGSIECADFSPDVPAIAGFMAGNGIYEHDLIAKDRFGWLTLKALENFRDAAAADQKTACANMWSTLGPSGLGLVKR